MHMSAPNKTEGPRRSETVLFIGAGAMAKLNCPTTKEQGSFIFTLCDRPTLVPQDIDDTEVPCFSECKQSICDFLNLVDYTEGERHLIRDDQKALLPKCYPDVDEPAAEKRVLELRDVFDWHVLKLVTKSKKGNATEYRNGFLQEVFTLMDACIREERGYSVYDDKGREIFLSPGRLLAARQILVHLINTMFACAYQKLLTDPQAKAEYKQYQAFAETLSRMMQTEGAALSNSSALSLRDFYLFSYSVVTTNFEPLFLWLFFQAHAKVNHESPISIDVRELKLFYDFPNTLGMYGIADDEEERLSPNIWYPMTEATVQVNNGRHKTNRLIRIGKYYFVHGSSNFRHCPKCGRLNLYLGDCWKEGSPSLFPSGLSAPFKWQNKPRDEEEEEAFSQGKYDAKKCLFCGQMTYAQDNFQLMQTLLKGTVPSFIKEITDEALAALSGARHVVLLGYSLPLDDAIWGSLLTAMIQRSRGKRPVYCSVVNGCQGPDRWLYGEDLKQYVENAKEKLRGDYGIRAIENAQAVFGKENVRAYTGGIPRIFHNGDEAVIREMMYPYRECPTAWDTTEWLRNGVVFRDKKEKLVWRRMYP